MTGNRQDTQMARWQPGSQGRLEAAALDLFIEHGYEQATVAEIAARAGLTERTFYRYFADKREVLFGGGPRLEALLTEEVSEAPLTAGPFDAIAIALDRMANVYFSDRGEIARRRQAVIDANPELQERELLKMASLSAALARTLRGRGVAEPTASLSAEAGVSVFRVAFAQWVTLDDNQSLGELIQSAFSELRAIAAQ
jgi:AcrR family transcriptional regulator